MYRCLLVACLSLPLVLTDHHHPVDLSHYYNDNTLCWGDSTRFHFTTVNNEYNGEYWYAANEFETAEHCGTHLDAPYHFNIKGWKVGDIPLERFIGQGVHINMRDKAEENANYEVAPEDFEAWEKEHGLIPKGAIVLLDFGWARKYNNRTLFFGTDSNDTSEYHFPGLSEQGAKWLVETGKVFGVGTDTASIDYGQSKDFISHRVLTEHNIYMMEHVNLPSGEQSLTGYKILALPMKLRSGTGAPVRVVALPP